MRKTFILPILALLIISIIGIVSANQTVSITKENQRNSGAIWTTRDDCGDEQQNVNQYYIGEHVYINGKNFNPGDYEWKIKGQPGQASCDPNLVVANGSVTTNQNGNFCFNAYTIAIDDCKEYKVSFNNKHDNYHVIPEFGLVAGIVTVLSAITIFFIIRKK